MRIATILCCIVFNVLHSKKVLCQEIDHGKIKGRESEEHPARYYLKDRFDNPFPNDEESIPSHNPEDIRFLLYYSTKKSYKYTILKFNDSSVLPIKKFHKRSPLKVLIHGYKQSGGENMVMNIKNSYIQLSKKNRKFKFNVLIVDWGRLSVRESDIDLESNAYFEAVKNVPVVGKRIARMINFLLRNKVVPTSRDVHLVGHSLGAHIAGEAGRDFVNTYPYWKIGRITGLDPVAPSFDFNITGRTLDKSDAHFVDVIHTNPGILGTNRNLGHVDFYPNIDDGSFQKQCTDMFHYEAQHAKRTLCSHSIAYQYFSKSIISDPSSMKSSHCNAITKQCDSWHSWVVFGEHIDTQRSPHGVYTVRIRL